MDDESIKLVEELSKTSNEIPPIGKDTNTDKKQQQKSERAFNFFASSIRRAENLLGINQKSPNVLHNISDHKLLDSYRAVIVLSISALDAYVKTFLIHEIKQRLLDRNLSNDLKKYIKEDLYNNNKEAFFDAALESDFFEKISSKFDDDFERKSFQGQKSINNYMKLAGFDKIFKRISQNANISEDNLQRDIERFTNRRHSIVHCGDFDLNQTEPKENLISEEDAKDCIVLVKLIATEIHKMNQIK